MGCVDSHSQIAPRGQQSTAPVQNYNQNSSTMFYQMQNMKRPKFLNTTFFLQPQQQETLWKIIQQDSYKEFAYFIENQRIPSNVEIGPNGTFWNFAHFCSRWNAFRCLQFIIKKVYNQNKTSVLSLMNQQTIQKYTAIHIAIEWNALSCFYLLIDSGGVDLSYTDKDNNDVFSKANLFKRQEMLAVLNKFKAGNALMILMQTQKIRDFKNFNQLINETEVKTQYRLTEQRIAQIVDTKNRMNRPLVLPAPTPVENKIKHEDYSNAIKKIQQSKSTEYSEAERGEEQANRLKLEELRRFQQSQINAKNRQKEALKKAMQQQREDEEQRLKNQVAQQIQRQKMYQQSELIKIEKQKQIIRKNIEAMSTSQAQAAAIAGKGTKMVCPQDIRPAYEAALARKSKFVDTQFKAQLKTLGNVKQYRFGWDNCVWLRPEQIFPGGRFQVFDGISPQDVQQGTLAVCYYLALLSSIAQHENRIKKIFRFYDKDLGFYAVQLYIEGKPITMIVDDLIPCMKGTNEPLFSKPRSPEVWVMILQKAWVKLFGSYLAAQKMAPEDMFQNVLPSPCRGYIVDISKIDEFFDKFVQFDKKNYIMTTSSRQNEQIPPGIIEGHSYSMIGAFNVNGVKICKIRNPWGKTQYQGMYSQSSPLWTPELKKAVGFQAGEDGIFYLNPTQLQSIMPCVAVSYYKDDYEYSYIQLQSKSNEDLYFVVNVKKKGELAIKVTQQQQRFRKDMIYQNCPIRLELSKIQENYDAKIVSQGEPSSMYHGASNLFSTQKIYQELDVGRYLIRLKVLYDRTYPISTRGTLRKFIRGTNGKEYLQVKQGKCCLSIYGPEKYVFNKIGKQEAEKYLKNMYRNYVNSSQKTSERLRSVGQDLQPMVIAKDCKMRNQIIYMAENLLPNNSINFQFCFNHNKFRNCSYAFNVDKQKEKCQWLIQPGKWNLATLQIDCPFQDIATQGQMPSNFKIVRT